MFKNIDPANKSIKPYKVYKDFTLTHNQSSSGYVVLRATGSSTFNFNTGSADSQSFGTYNNYTKKFSLGTYYDIPNWRLINKLYYKDADKPYQAFGGNQTKVQKRQLHNTARIFSIPQELFGEKIKPKSIELEDTSNGKTFIIKDDGDGNLYDDAFSASFAAYKSGGFTQFPTITKGSGSQVGNVFYEHGIMVITDTGSYHNVGLGVGHELKYKATHTNYEYEYMVNAAVGEYNTSTNISTTFERSGSRTLPEGTVSMSKFMPPGDQPNSNGIGTFKSFYNAAGKYEGFTTHSLFKPYVTTIGLYNDNNELLAVGKLARAIKLSDDYETNFIVRFDI